MLLVVKDGELCSHVYDKWNDMDNGGRGRDRFIAAIEIVGIRYD